MPWWSQHKKDPPRFLGSKRGGIWGSKVLFFVLLWFRVFGLETANSEARFGILVKNQPGWQILSHIGAIWIHVVAISRSPLSQKIGAYPKHGSWRKWDMQKWMMEKIFMYAAAAALHKC